MIISGVGIRQVLPSLAKELSKLGYSKKSCISVLIELISYRKVIKGGHDLSGSVDLPNGTLSFLTRYHIETARQAKVFFHALGIILINGKTYAQTEVDTGEGYTERQAFFESQSYEFSNEFLDYLKDLLDKKDPVWSFEPDPLYVKREQQKKSGVSQRLKKYTKVFLSNCVKLGKVVFPIKTESVLDDVLPRGEKEDIKPSPSEKKPEEAPEPKKSPKVSIENLTKSLASDCSLKEAPAIDLHPNIPALKKEFYYRNFMKIKENHGESKALSVVIGILKHNNFAKTYNEGLLILKDIIKSQHGLTPI